MNSLNELLQELGISKVRLAKYLNVSRQMVYNYLELEDINKWPKEKKILLLKLLDIEDGDESLTLAICNKMTRELKLAKVFVDQSLKTVSATCEFYYANDEALEYSIKKSLRLIGLMRSQYQQNREELTK